MGCCRLCGWNCHHVLHHHLELLRHGERSGGGEGRGKGAENYVVCLLCCLLAFMNASMKVLFTSDADCRELLSIVLSARADFYFKHDYLYTKVFLRQFCYECKGKRQGNVNVFSFVSRNVGHRS